MKTLWENFLRQQEAKMGPTVVKRWLRPLRLIHFDARNLYLEAKDPFLIPWFEEHVRHKTKGFKNTNGASIQIHIASSFPLQGKIKTPPKEVKKDTRGEANTFSISHATLSQYLPTKKNKASYELIKETLQHTLDNHSTSLHNPLYLYGPPGSGKTHLLLALTEQMEKKKKVLCVKAETFTKHFVKAIREGDISVFRKTYRHIDVLLVDDIEVFSQKKATQEEFFHTFNTLHIAEKQMVFTSRFHPNALEGIEERLTSRFAWGLAIPIIPIEEEVKSLLSMRKRFFSLNFSLELEEYLLSHFSGADALSRAIEALALHRSLHPKLKKKQELTLEDVREVLASFAQKLEKKAPSAEEIIALTANLFEMTSEDLIGREQSREYSFPRQIAMYTLRKELGIPYQKIGALFQRDHSTIMTGVKLVMKKIERGDKIYTDAVQELSQKLYK